MKVAGALLLELLELTLLAAELAALEVTLLAAELAALEVTLLVAELAALDVLEDTLLAEELLFVVQVILTLDTLLVPTTPVPFTNKQV